VTTSSVARFWPSRSITPHTDFQAEVYVLSKEEGGRHTPFFANYRPQFYFRTDVTGTVELPEGTEMVMPGDNVALGVKLIAPIAMDDRSALRDPRRRPYRRRRRRQLDRQVSLGRKPETYPKGPAPATGSAFFVCGFRGADDSPFRRYAPPSLSRREREGARPRQRAGRVRAVRHRSH
jgi:hypothetical protein